MNKIVVFIALIFCLWIGRSVLIPLAVATFFWYLINAIASYYRRIMPCYKDENGSCKLSYKLYNLLSIILSFATLGIFLYLFATQIKPMLVEFYRSIPIFQQRLIEFSDYVSARFDISTDINLIPNLTRIAGSIGSSVAGLATSTGMALIFLIFLFIEQSSFRKKLDTISLPKLKTKKLHYILESIDENMKKYLFTKTLISAATGLSGYVVLSLIGLEYAGVWGFILFILNYIPTIGSIVACVLPILYSLISTDTWQIPFITTISLIIIQTIFGNILDPKLTGKTLNLSALAILINLVLWGMLWGPIGMFFSVPVLVTVYIVSAQFDSTRWIAVLLSANGDIPDETKND